MDAWQKIAAWHEQLLGAALAWRANHPEFRFCFRTRDNDEGRLAKGYWFTGNDDYLFFAPFRPNDQNNKTKTVGFVVLFNEAGDPSKCYLEIVFGGARPKGLAKVHEEIVSTLGGFREVSKRHKYQRTYASPDPLVSFQEFLSKDHPRICEIIQAAGQNNVFLVSDDKFQKMFATIEALRSRKSTRPVPQPVRTEKTPCKNLILYGPPGTGKTHWLRAKFADYTDAPEEVDEDTRIQETLAAFGWRSVIAASLADLGRPARVPEIRAHRWVSAKTRERGRLAGSVTSTIWGRLMDHTPESSTTVKAANRRPPAIFSKSENSEWELMPDWKDADPESVDLLRLLGTKSTSTSEAIRRYRTVTFHPSFGYEDFVRGIRPVAVGEDGATQFRVVDGAFKQICDEARRNPGKRYALFIDEINRANIAKVFGELITLIEPDKRAVFDEAGRLTHGMAVQLPGGEDAEVAEPRFGVPPNLDIFGTMNTADRSIALLDVALRRRFEFMEMEPNETLLGSVGKIDLGSLLRQINDRLEFLLDRDHRIGHAYLMNLGSLEDLQRVFRVQIIPLLQEYFFDDFARVATVLSTSATASAFVSRQRVLHRDLFAGPSSEGVPESRDRFVITKAETWTEGDFRAIYSPATSDADSEVRG
ncbi:MAG: AAA family ATPase [Planctomycetota bacterium]